MTGRRWVSFGFVSLAAMTAVKPAAAQLAPTGGHYAARSSDTGYAGAVNSLGGYGASVPLDIPPARGGLPIPVQIAYSEHGVGAAGRGWDVPISYLRRDTTLARRRPVGTPGIVPQAREQVSLVLEGRQLDLVKSGTDWVARRDAPDIVVREQNDGTWVMFDGQFRTYRFATVSPALAGADLWLLQDVSGVGGSNVHLDYGIAAVTLPGGPAITIDLIGVSYNPSPTITGCYKNEVSLTYDGNTATPLSLAVMGNKVLARQHKLVTVDVSARESCSTNNVRLRRYQFNYAPDADTQQPRLQSVQVFGRAGTPEGNTALPVASYTYGTASNTGKLTYQSVAMSGLGTDLGHTESEEPALPAYLYGNGYATSQMLVDFTGDGRPDVVSTSRSESPYALSVKRNTPSGEAIVFSQNEPWASSVMAGRPLEARTTLPTADMVWTQAMDVNGDGRIDFIDAAVKQGHWVIYLNTPDPADPTKVRWVERAVSITALAQQLKNRGLPADPYSQSLLPLGRRRTLALTVASITCWIFNGVEWVEDENGNSNPGCHGYSGPYPESTITEWELKDLVSLR